MNSPLPPGSTLGILGGGQLGRMTALAAANLGFRVHIFEPEGGCPASQVAERHHVAAYNDAESLRVFAAQCDAITLEFENVPADSVRLLEELKPVHPGATALDICQHRIREKQFVREAGIGTAEFAAVVDLPAAIVAGRTLGYPFILKTCRFGYDGKGQVRVASEKELPAALESLRSNDLIAEAMVPFAHEISVIAARGQDGVVRCYEPSLNVHRDHILHTSTVDGSLPEAVRREAMGTAARLAERMQIIGLLAVEMFLLEDGSLLVNEMAPRPHNSGHWTQDACVTSQFEQLVRAVCGWPLGEVARTADAVMENLIGDEVDAWARHAADPSVKLHIYGKAEARPGRKMGHINRIIR